MKIFVWNVRGLGKLARHRQIRDYIFQEKVYVVGLQKTLREDFSDSFLHDLSGDLPFAWKWLLVRGRSGGILLGIKVDSLEMEDSSMGEFNIHMTIRNRLTNFR